MYTCIFPPPLPHTRTDTHTRALAHPHTHTRSHTRTHMHLRVTSIMKAVYIFSGGRRPCVPPQHLLAFEIISKSLQRLRHDLSYFDRVLSSLL